MTMAHHHWSIAWLAWRKVKLQLQFDLCVCEHFEINLFESKTYFMQWLFCFKTWKSFRLSSSLWINEYIAESVPIATSHTMICWYIDLFICRQKHYVNATTVCVPSSARTKLPHTHTYTHENTNIRTKHIWSICKWVNVTEKKVI